MVSDADPTLSLMVHTQEVGESSKVVREVQEEEVDDKQREELFHIRIQVKKGSSRCYHRPRESEEPDIGSAGQ